MNIWREKERWKAVRGFLPWGSRRRLASVDPRGGSEPAHHGLGRSRDSSRILFHCLANDVFSIIIERPSLSYPCFLPRKVGHWLTSPGGDGGTIPLRHLGADRGCVAWCEPQPVSAGCGAWARKATVSSSGTCASGTLPASWGLAPCLALPLFSCELGVTVSNRYKVPWPPLLPRHRPVGAWLKNAPYQWSDRGGVKRV